MKYGLFLSAVHDVAREKSISFEEALRLVGEMGYSRIECSFGDIAADPEGFKATLEKNGFEVGDVYHATDLIYACNIEDGKRHIDAAARVGSPYAMVVCNLISSPEEKAEKRELLAKNLNILCEYARGTGVEVIVEDYDDARSLFATADDLAFLFERVPTLGLTFDAGNFLWAGDDVLPTYERFKAKLRHVHLKDYGEAPDAPVRAKIALNGERLHTYTVGEGKTGIKELVSLLERDSFDGTAVVEMGGQVSMTDSLRICAERLKNGF